MVQRQKPKTITLSAARDFDERWEAFGEDDGEVVLYMTAPTRTMALYGIKAVAAKMGWKVKTRGH